MSFLSYKVVRGTCLRFPEQLEVVVAGDVLQQRLPACSVALAVILAIEGMKESRKTFNASNGEFFCFLGARYISDNSHPLTMCFSFCSLLRLEFRFLLSSVTFSL